MVVREQVINRTDIDSFWEFVCLPENADKRFELIQGEIVEMPQPGEDHGFLAGAFYHFFRMFDPESKIGVPSVGAGFFSIDDETTMLAPDAAFRLVSQAGEGRFRKWAPVMPAIAIEVVSPSNTMAQLRRKAAILLSLGTQLVWIVIPDRQGVEVWRLDSEGQTTSEFVDIDGSLSGESVLPGFTLPLREIFG